MPLNKETKPNQSLVDEDVTVLKEWPAQSSDLKIIKQM